MRGKKERENEANMRRRKIYFCGGKEKLRGKKRNIFGERQYIILYIFGG